MTLTMRNYGLVLPKNYVSIEKDEMEYIDGGGFVGFTIHLPQWLVNLGAWAAAAYVGGNIGFRLLPYAKTPQTAGVVALVTAGAAAIAGWAVSNLMNSFQMGTWIPFLDWNYDIYL